MQVTAMHPQFISEEEIPPEKKDDFEVETACLLQQAYIKDPTMTVQDVIIQVLAKVGENIKVSRFTRFELGTR
jgi:elongation factor Ts